MEESLENSKKNAQDLNNLIKGVYKNLNDTILNQQQQQPDGNKQIVLPPPQKQNDPETKKIAILVISCNRDKSVENHLNQLIKYREKSNRVEKFPIVVSQDCNDGKTADAIKTFSNNLFLSIKVFIYLFLEVYLIF